MDLCKRAISVFLVLAMAFSFMPTFAAAAEAELFLAPAATEAEELTPPVETEALTETTVETTVPTDTLPDLIVSSEAVPVIAETVETLAAEEAETAATSGTCGDNLTWTYAEDTKTLTISGQGEMDGYNLEERPWDGFREEIEQIIIEDGASSISKGAFSDCSQLTKVTIPNTVMTIAYSAFENCTSLPNVVLPEKLESFGDWAFQNCSSLRAIEIPSSVANISYAAFKNCSSLSSVKLPDNLERIRMQAFQNCTSLTEIVIPDKITCIDDWAFQNCSSLRAIEIPSSVANISYAAFKNCSSLSSVKLPDKITRIDDYAFESCTSLSNVELPSNLEIIGWDSFNNCSALTNIEFPESLNSLSEGSFRNCTSLTTIWFHGNNPFWPDGIGEDGEGIDVFSGVVADAYYPENNVTWTDYPLPNLGGELTWMAFDSGVAASGLCGDYLAWVYNEDNKSLRLGGVGDMYDYDADNTPWIDYQNDIETIIIEDNVESISSYAFYNHSSLKNVKTGYWLDEIPDSAFENCTSLQNVEFDPSLAHIQSCAFKNCSSLESIELFVNSIGIDAFYNCTSLTSIRFDSYRPSFEENDVFHGVVAKAYYPANDSDWTEDVLLDYGGKLTWVAYDDEGNLSGTCGENVTWQLSTDGQMTISGVETTEAAAYSARSTTGCRMDDYASAEETPWYDYQDQIITVTIEGTVDYVGSNAFSGCPNLNSVTIEDGVEEIHSTAFSNCPALETVYYAGSEDDWNAQDVDTGNAQVHYNNSSPDAHTETKTTVAPTCTEKGYDLYECSCGSSRKENYTEALGHDLVNPTYDSSTKTHTFSCSRCDYTETEDCTFDEGKVITEATEDAPGEKEFTCSVCGGTYTEEFAYVSPEAASVTRIYGQTRYETAMAIADELKNELGVETFKTILVANGGDFPDALAGSYLASQKNAPILLAQNSKNSKVNGSVVDYIEKNLRSDGMVYILGGTSAVSEEFADALEEAGIAYKRLSGKTRYDTGLKILEEAGLNGNELLVCTGANFADALSVSAVNKPILLVNGKDTKLTEAQKEYLDALEGGYTFYIIGGTGAVSAELETAFEAYGSVERISGTDRHATSVAVAEKFFADVDCAALAYSMNYPDGLCGGVLAYKLGAPLLLVNPVKGETAAADYVKENSVTKGIVFGGTAGITDEAVRTVFGLPEDAEIK